MSARKATPRKKKAEAPAESEPQAKKARKDKDEIAVSSSSEPSAVQQEPTSLQTTLSISDKNVLEMLQKQRPRYPISDEFLVFMARMRPQDLSLKEKSIITFQRSDSLSHVMKTLSAHNILSAPVVTQVGTYHGFIDVLDVVRFVTDLVGETMISKNDFELEKIEDFRNATVQQLMIYPISKRNPFHPVNIDQSLLSVMEILAKGVHRVPIVNDKNEIKHLVTQSSVIKFIRAHLSLLGAKKNMKIHETETGVQYVVSILHSERTIDAFKMLKICNVSGIAVVDDNGILIGVLSGRDIKRISSTAAWISRLFKPVSEFIHNKPVVVRPDDTFAHAIEKCVDNEVHRLFVVNDDHEPIGVLSLTDILRELLTKA